MDHFHSCHSKMSIKVKICGITSVQDGLTAVQYGADLIGLMFYDQSPRAISLNMASEISRSLPASILKVGVFVNPHPKAVYDAIEACQLSMLQFHGQEAPDFCTQFGIMSMKAFRIQNGQSLNELANYKTDAFLLDAFSSNALGGTGQSFNWSLVSDAKKLIGKKPLFLAGGLTPLNVAHAIVQTMPFAVDVSSGVESAPGRKDPEKMKDFISAAKAVCTES